MEKIIQKGGNSEIIVETVEANSILYFIIDSKGEIQESKKLEIKENKIKIEITSEVTGKLQPGANSIKVFAISDSVLKPDFYESSFLVSETDSNIPSLIINPSDVEKKNRLQHVVNSN